MGNSFMRRTIHNKPEHNQINPKNYSTTLS